MLPLRLTSRLGGFWVIQCPIWQTYKFCDYVNRKIPSNKIGQIKEVYFIHALTPPKIVLSILSTHRVHSFYWRHYWVLNRLSLSHRGHSTTMWTEFCHFLTPRSPAWTILYPGQKQTIFDPLPPHLVHLVIECPLVSKMGQKIKRNNHTN